VTGASRFLIGLVSCSATHDGIPAELAAHGAATLHAARLVYTGDGATLTRHLDTGDLDTPAHITDTLLHRLKIPPPR
jgi:hypothetical protein